MTHFTPWESLYGGALIGAAAVMLMLLNGRIAGVSGITAGLLSFKSSPDSVWRVGFVAGVVGAPLALDTAGLMHPAIAFVVPWPLMIAAGFLVGFGSVLGNGCTSGHGVCGISRLSPRSFVATGIFMVTGIATAIIIQHLLKGP